MLAVMYVTLFFVGPLQRGPFTHRNGGDPVLLNAFFFLYLAASGGGAWSVDRLRGRESADDRWAHTTLGVLRIIAGCLFVMHGLEKLFGVGGGRIDRDITTMRGLAGWLEAFGGPLIITGLFTRPVAFILSGEMAVAYFRSWAPRGFWQSFTLPGMEASILFCYLFLFLCAAGPGAWSVDELLRRRARHAVIRESMIGEGADHAWFCALRGWRARRRIDPDSCRAERQRGRRWSEPRGDCRARHPSGRGVLHREDGIS